MRRCRRATGLGALLRHSRDPQPRKALCTLNINKSHDSPRHSISKYNQDADLTQRLKAALDAEHSAPRNSLRKLLEVSPSMAIPDPVSPLVSQQTHLFNQLKALLEKTPSLGRLRDGDALIDPARWLCTAEVLASALPQLSLKLSEHVLVFGRTLATLGTGWNDGANTINKSGDSGGARLNEARSGLTDTDRRWTGTTANRVRTYVDRFDQLDLQGCLCATEIGHGTNLRALECTAVWNARLFGGAGGFVLSTGSESAAKFWISNSVRRAEVALVLARLMIDDEDRGVHVFTVPLRDSESGHVLPGVRVRDIGVKSGMNGIDSGCVSFTAVRITRDSLLNRHAGINKEGKYELHGLTDSFTAAMQTFNMSRIHLAMSANGATKLGMVVALKYATERKQFGPRNQDEVSLLEFSTHQLRLLPILARTFSLHFALADLAQSFGTADLNISSTHLDDSMLASISALKVASTSHASTALRTMRECSGAAALRVQNRIATLIADIDMFTTIEGDNTALQLQIARRILRRNRHITKRNNVVHATAEDVDIGVAKLGNAADWSWVESLLESRRNLLLVKLAERLQSSNFDDEFYMWNDALPSALRLVDAESDFIVFTALCRRYSHTTELAPLCDILALDLLRHDMGWFLDNQLVSVGIGARVDERLQSICREFANVAPSYASAFAIPRGFVPDDFWQLPE